MIRKSLVVLAALFVAPGAASAAVTVKGSDTMVILAQRWAEEYMKKDPSKKVQVTGGGSGTGIAALINGTTDIANSSREIKPSEKKQLEKRFNTPGVETAVAKDGVTFYVHESNPLRSLTVEQLRKIYQGEISSWKDVGGPDAPIVVYSRENSSGTYVFVKDHVLSGGDFVARAQTLPGTAAVVNAVAKEKNGIGYGGAAYAKGVRELQVENVDPTEANIRSGKYPLARDLYMYTRAQPKGEAKEFIDFCLSQEGQKVVTAVGYFPVK
jgi:phosphate transport system substrate-binding protein